MSVLHALRGTRPDPDPASDGGQPGAPGGSTQWPSRLLLSARDGLLTAAAGVLLLAVPALLAWLADSRASGAPAEPVRVAASLWLLSQGARLSVGEGTVALAPLLLTLALVALGAWSAGRGLRRTLAGELAAADAVTGPVPRSALDGLLGWWAGYAAGAGAAAALTPATARPVWWTLLGPLVLVPVVAGVAALARVARTRPEVLGPWPVPTRVPAALRGAVGPAVAGVVALVLAGSLLVLLAVTLRVGSVADVYGAVEAGVVGAALLTAAQPAVLPNLGLWALSFAAGPGFAAVAGATTTWEGGPGATLPLVPVLAALPQPGDYPWAVRLLVLVPMLCGAEVGRRSLRTVARLASLRTKATVAATAAVLAAAGTGALDALAGGSLGAERLAGIGAPAVPLALVLAAELLAGALAVVLLDAWRLRR